MVRGSVEETLNGLLEAEAVKLTGAAKYERNEERQGYRSGYYSRNLTTASGDVILNVHRLKGISFETAIIEWYRRRESSVEEALIEMYLAGVSVRRVEDITEALWGTQVSPSTISELNKKTYVHIWLCGRGVHGLKLVVGDKCLGMLEAVGEVFPEAKYQRCTVHFYRNVFPVVPRSKGKLVAKMLKAIHAQESKKATREKAASVVVARKEMKLKKRLRRWKTALGEP